MKKSPILRLNGMMFLQYFAYGSWYATAGLILANHDLSSITGLFYSMGAIAGMISPFFLGMVVDRFFASEKVLAVLNVLGAIILWFMPGLIESGNGSAILWLLFVYMLTFVPTIALTNNIAFQNVENGAKSFPIIRVFGTIGWISSGLIIGQMGLSDSTVVLKIAAVAQILFSLYCFILPHTPAHGKGKPISVRDILCLDALGMLKDRNYLIFMVCSLLICIPLSAYYSFTSAFLGASGIENVASVMTIGQASEFIFMILIPVFFRRLGVKYMLLVGMLAWVLRYAFFAIGGPSEVFMMLLAAIALHGISYDFFFVTASIYADKKASKNLKGQAQSLYVLATQGIGMFFGSIIAGQIFNSVVTGEGNVMAQWQIFWIIPAALALVIAFLFLYFFKKETISADEEVPVNNNNEEPVINPTL